MLAEFAARFSPRGVKSVVTSGTGIVLGTQIAGNIIRVVSTLILTRLLSPGDYGVVGIITVTHYSIVMLSDLGIDSYIVRKKLESDKHALDVIWTIKLIRLMAIALALCVAAWPLALFFGKPELTWVIVFSSLAFVAAAPQSLSMTLAVRQQRIFKISAIDIGLAILTLCMSIALAIFIQNFWAVLIPMIIVGFLKTILSFVWFADSGHKLAFDRAVADDLWGFARYAFPSSILTLGILQIDKVVFGSTLSLTQFGLYMLAASIATMPKSFSDNLGMRVLLPAYAQTFREAPDQLPTEFYRMTRYTGPIYAFLVGGLIAFAPVVIAIMYQDRYGDAARYLSIFCIPIMFAMINIAATECMFAVGEVRVTFFANVVRLAWLLPTMGYAFWLGNVDLMLAAVALSELPACIFLNWWLWRKGIFSITKLMPTLLAAILGVLTGWLAYRGVAMFFEIGPVGLLP